jgi:uncharacterized cupredoxin-like copper-binding protein
MGYKTGMRFNHTQASLKPHASPTSKPSNTFYDKENTMRTSTIFLAAALLAVSVAAQASGSHAGGHAHDGPSIGQPGQADKVSRTVSIDMQDNMRFVPATVAVKQGETIRIVVRNTGALAHELVLGNIKDLKAHAKVMQKFPDMEHEESNMLSVAPGGQGELIWHFTSASTVDFACLRPGHYEAGMKGKIQVAKGKAAAKNKEQHDAHKH